MKRVAWVAVALVVASVLGLAQSDAESTFSQILRPGLTLSVDKGCGNTYRYGENLQIRVRSERAGYLTVFHFSADGKAQILFPNQYHRDNRIRGSEDYTIPGSLFPFQLRIGPPAGKELLFGVVTEREQKLVPDDYVDFTQVFPALKEEWSRSASTIVRGVSVLPPDMWWGAAMCLFYVETGPTDPPPPPPPTTWGMSGRVTTSGGAGVADVTITFTRVSGSGSIPSSVRTDASGTWSQTGFASGTTYRATPTKTGCTFSPSHLDRSSASTTVNFAGTCPTTPTTWGMSGRVTTSSGAGVADVTITFTRLSGSGSIPSSVRTDASGRWSQTGFASGTTYRATPTKTGCTFSPSHLDRSSASTTVNFAGTCAPPPSTTGSGWALFVGISTYSVNRVTVDGVQATLSNLSAPASEARRMAEALKDLFPNQRVLTDSAATYDAIKRGFTEWLSQAPADATVLFYFCGHGGQQRDTLPDLDEADGKDETLFTTDGKVIVDDEVHAWTTALRAQKVVIIADSCHSGTIHRGVFTFEVPLSRDLPTVLTDGFADDFWSPGQRAPSKVVALSACRPNEYTLETTRLTGEWRALFSYHLLEGLKGKADKNGDKVVTAQELLAYAQTAVAQWLATLPEKDRPSIQPQLHDGLGIPVPLVKLP